MNISIELPWPPTVNTYWRRHGNRYFISNRGQIYKKQVMQSCLIYNGLFGSDSRLKLHIDAYPPDKRKRDLDNLLKGIIDSLMASNLFADDNQIDELSIKRIPLLENKVVIHLMRI